MKHHKLMSGIKEIIDTSGVDSKKEPNVFYFETIFNVIRQSVRDILPNGAGFFTDSEFDIHHLEQINTRIDILTFRLAVVLKFRALLPPDEQEKFDTLQGAMVIQNIGAQPNVAIYGKDKNTPLPKPSDVSGPFSTYINLLSEKHKFTLPSLSESYEAQKKTLESNGVEDILLLPPDVETVIRKVKEFIVLQVQKKDTRRMS